MTVELTSSQMRLILLGSVKQLSQEIALGAVVNG